MHYHRMNILVRLILYRMKKQRNFENAEMLSHISDHNDIGMSGKNFGPLKWYTDRNFFGDGGGGKLFREKFFGRPCLSLRPPKNEGLATPLLIRISLKIWICSHLHTDRHSAVTMNIFIFSKSDPKKRWTKC